VQPRLTASNLSVALSGLMTAPGLVIGLEGLADGIGPIGLEGLIEMAGFVFCAWSVFQSTNSLTEQFLVAPFSRAAQLVAAIVVCGGFFLLMSTIGSDASIEHKRYFTVALQPLGWCGAALLVARTAWRLRFRRGK
jgi:hypothetical protein